MRSFNIIVCSSAANSGQDQAIVSAVPAPNRTLKRPEASNPPPKMISSREWMESGSRSMFADPRPPATTGGFNKEFIDFIQSPRVPDRFDEEEDEEEAVKFWICDPEVYEKEQERRNLLRSKRKSTHNIPYVGVSNSLQNTAQYPSRTDSRAQKTVPALSTQGGCERRLLSSSIVRGFDQGKGTGSYANIAAHHSIVPVAKLLRNRRQLVGTLKARVEDQVTLNQTNVEENVSCYAIGSEPSNGVLNTSEVSSTQANGIVSHSESLNYLKKKLGHKTNKPLTKVIPPTQGLGQHSKILNRIVSAVTYGESVCKSSAKAKVFADWQSSDLSMVNAPMKFRSSSWSGYSLKNNDVNNYSETRKFKASKPKKSRKNAGLETKVQQTHSESGHRGKVLPNSSPSLQSWFTSRRTTSLDMQVLDNCPPSLQIFRNPPPANRSPVASPISSSKAVVMTIENERKPIHETSKTPNTSNAEDTIVYTKHIQIPRLSLRSVGVQCLSATTPTCGLCERPASSLTFSSMDSNPSQTKAIFLCSNPSSRLVDIQGPFMTTSPSQILTNHHSTTISHTGASYAKKLAVLPKDIRLEKPPYLSSSRRPSMITRFDKPLDYSVKTLRSIETVSETHENEQVFALDLSRKKKDLSSSASKFTPTTWNDRILAENLAKNPSAFSMADLSRGTVKVGVQARTTVVQDSTNVHGVTSGVQAKQDNIESIESTEMVRGQSVIKLGPTKSSTCDASPGSNLKRAHDLTTSIGRDVGRTPENYFRSPEPEVGSYLDITGKGQPEANAATTVGTIDTMHSQMASTTYQTSGENLTSNETVDQLSSASGSVNTPNRLNSVKNVKETPSARVDTDFEDTRMKNIDARNILLHSQQQSDLTITSGAKCSEEDSVFSPRLSSRRDSNLESSPQFETNDSGVTGYSKENKTNSANTVDTMVSQMTSTIYQTSGENLASNEAVIHLESDGRLAKASAPSARVNTDFEETKRENIDARNLLLDSHQQSDLTITSDVICSEEASVFSTGLSSKRDGSFESYAQFETNDSCVTGCSKGNEINDGDGEPVVDELCTEDNPEETEYMGASTENQAKTGGNAHPIGNSVQEAKEFIMVQGELRSNELSDLHELVKPSSNADAERKFPPKDRYSVLKEAEQEGNDVATNSDGTTNDIVAEFIENKDVSSDALNENEASGRKSSSTKEYHRASKKTGQDDMMVNFCTVLKNVGFVEKEKFNPETLNEDDAVNKKSPSLKSQDNLNGAKQETNNGAINADKISVGIGAVSKRDDTATEKENQPEVVAKKTRANLAGAKPFLSAKKKWLLRCKISENMNNHEAKFDVVKGIESPLEATVPPWLRDPSVGEVSSTASNDCPVNLIEFEETKPKPDIVKENEHQSDYILDPLLVGKDWSMDAKEKSQILESVEECTGNVCSLSENAYESEATVDDIIVAEPLDMTDKENSVLDGVTEGRSSPNLTPQKSSSDEARPHSPVTYDGESLAAAIGDSYVEEASSKTSNECASTVNLIGFDKTKPKPDIVKENEHQRKVKTDIIPDYIAGKDWSMNAKENSQILGSVEGYTGSVCSLNENAYESEVTVNDIIVAESLDMADKENSVLDGVTEGRSSPNLASQKSISDEARPHSPVTSDDVIPESLVTAVGDSYVGEVSSKTSNECALTVKLIGFDRTKPKPDIVKENEHQRKVKTDHIPDYIAGKDWSMDAKENSQILGSVEGCTGNVCSLNENAYESEVIVDDIIVAESLHMADKENSFLDGITEGHSSPNVNLQKSSSDEIRPDSPVTSDDEVEVESLAAAVGDPYVGEVSSKASNDCASSTVYLIGFEEAKSKPDTVKENEHQRNIKTDDIPDHIAGKDKIMDAKENSQILGSVEGCTGNVCALSENKYQPEVTVDEIIVAGAVDVAGKKNSFLDGITESRNSSNVTLQKSSSDEVRLDSPATSADEITPESLDTIMKAKLEREKVINIENNKGKNGNSVERAAQQERHEDKFQCGSTRALEDKTSVPEFMDRRQSHNISEGTGKCESKNNLAASSIEVPQNSPELQASEKVKVGNNSSNDNSRTERREEQNTDSDKSDEVAVESNTDESTERETLQYLRKNQSNISSSSRIQQSLLHGRHKVTNDKVPELVKSESDEIKFSPLVTTERHGMITECLTSTSVNQAQSTEVDKQMVEEGQKIRNKELFGFEKCKEVDETNISSTGVAATEFRETQASSNPSRVNELIDEVTVKKRNCNSEITPSIFLHQGQHINCDTDRELDENMAALNDSDELFPGLRTPPRNTFINRKTSSDNQDFVEANEACCDEYDNMFLTADEDEAEMVEMTQNNENLKNDSTSLDTTKKDVEKLLVLKEKDRPIEDAAPEKSNSAENLTVDSDGTNNSENVETKSNVSVNKVNADVIDAITTVRNLKIPADFQHKFSGGENTKSITLVAEENDNVLLQEIKETNRKKRETTHNRNSRRHVAHIITNEKQSIPHSHTNTLYMHVLNPVSSSSILYTNSLGNPVKRKTHLKLGYNTHTDLNACDVKIKRRKLVRRDDLPTPETPNIPKKSSYFILSDSSDSSEESDRFIKINTTKRKLKKRSQLRPQNTAISKKMARIKTPTTTMSSIQGEAMDQILHEDSVLQVNKRQEFSECSQCTMSDSEKYSVSHTPERKINVHHQSSGIDKFSDPSLRACENTQNLVMTCSFSERPRSDASEITPFCNDFTNENKITIFSRNSHPFSLHNQGSEDKVLYGKIIHPSSSNYTSSEFHAFNFQSGFSSTSDTATPKIIRLKGCVRDPSASDNEEFYQTFTPDSFQGSKPRPLTPNPFKSIRRRKIRNKIRFEAFSSTEHVSRVNFPKAMKMVDTKQIKPTCISSAPFPGGESRQNCIPAVLEALSPDYTGLQGYKVCTKDVGKPVMQPCPSQKPNLSNGHEAGTMYAAANMSSSKAGKTAKFKESYVPKVTQADFHRAFPKKKSPFQQRNARIKGKWERTQMRTLTKISVKPFVSHEPHRLSIPERNEAICLVMQKLFEMGLIKDSMPNKGIPAPE